MLNLSIRKSAVLFASSLLIFFPYYLYVIWSDANNNPVTINICFALLALIYCSYLFFDKSVVALGYFSPHVFIMVFFLEQYYFGQFSYNILVSVAGSVFGNSELSIITSKIYLCGLLGVVSGVCISNITKVGINNYNYNRIRFVNSVKATKVIILLLTASVVASLLFFVLQGVPLLYDNIEGGRIEATEGMNYLFAIILQFVNASILAIVAFYSNSRLKLSICLVISVVFLIMFGYRGPIASIIFFFLMWYSFVYKKIGIIKGYLITHTLLYSGVVLGIFRARLDLSSIINFLYTTSYVEYREIINAIDKVNGFLDGMSYYSVLFLPIPSSVYANKPNGLGMYLKNTLYGDSYQGGAIRVSQLGEAYLNFGFIGVYVIFFMIGVIVYVSNEKLKSKVNNANKDLFGIFKIIVLLNVFYVFIVGDSSQAAFTFFKDSVIMLMCGYYIFKRNNSIIDKMDTL